MDQSNIVLVESNNTSFQIVKIEEFLAEKQKEDIFVSLCENENDFFACGEGMLSKHLFFKERCEEEQFKNLNKACEVLSQGILKIMPDIFSVLDVKPFPLSRIRFNFIHGLDGHFGEAHSDDYGTGLDVTLLYYFHEKPKSFSGGDLEFYDNLEDKNVIKKIPYEDNLFIAFPSDKVHGVTRVLCDSDKFEAGRFVAVTFIGANSN